ncbi:proline--tRNA ligase [candidate division KSB3 bacterium]|uniref:Proline--tRNA ligase n=1 Tax=candidate division KSB3 bacterium TaxID=2044937 RepID=A0A2G6E770_9BACT|nr:MAG: proline--tRNA ligase [candidate division KSB3 bacterium]PIE30308.1 MAG: proline--tRNA ligase [candidate division KSB3 bacterium]
MAKTKITKQSDDFSKWYVDTVLHADMADYGPVKGCMVIKPYGYNIWENIQQALDTMFKDSGHVNAYFPLFIPESFLKKEAEHVEGFAPECAVVTHGGGKELEEALVIRPTSETIIWEMYRKWIDSHRDLPILINQWANVVRWEMRTRLFLRTTEFLWQEGHTAHATEAEAEEEVAKILDIYAAFAEEFAAVPVLKGRKSEKEKFAGALYTTCVEALMKDRRALQWGTSHHLGQNFAKAFDVTYQTTSGTREYVWATSWGVSTRMIGGLIMMHGDDKGLKLPPKLAPHQLVIVPIYYSAEERQLVMEKVDEISAELKQDVRVKIDDRDNYKPGWKFHEWEMKGVPLRMEIGPRDVAANHVVIARRDKGPKEKSSVSIDGIGATVKALLDDIQQSMFDAALAFREEHSHRIDSYDEFKTAIEEKGGFLYAHWCGSSECEQTVQDETKATIRCIPFDRNDEPGTCLCCGKTATARVPFAKAY